jgi:CRP/FNR family transcriptional regulator, nitrogen oxide reductase regulator
MRHSRPSSAACASSAFLAGLEQSATSVILGAAEFRWVPAKHMITTGGHPATHTFLVQSGRARYCHLTKKGEVVLLAQLAPGDVIGLLTMLKNPSAYMATAEAASDCELLVWDRAAVRRFVSLYPQLGENSFRIALGYLRNYIERHVGLITETAVERLAKTLLRLGRQSGEIHPDGVEIHTTNEELSALADISRFTASRALSDWVRAGTITKGRGRILIHAPEALMVD